jgi:hypothetical protein
MVAPIKQTVTVQPDGHIEIRSPQLRPGARAEVIVLMEQENKPSALTPLEAFQKLQDSLKLTPEAAQKWIDEAHAERQTWGNRK